MKSVLVYVISATTQPYRPMIDNQMATWDDAELEGVETIYYTGNPPFEPAHPRVVSFPIDEAYETMGYKDLLAYRWALENRQWDYMARVNASCYVHKRRLRDYVQSLPEEGIMCGLVCGAHPYCGVTRDFMWGGGQYIFSRDVIETFLSNQDKWNHRVMEDVAMSELAHDCGIALLSKGRVCSINQEGSVWKSVTYGGESTGGAFEKFADMAPCLHDQFFFRVKHDGNREMDATTMRLLKQYLPP